MKLMEFMNFSNQYGFDIAADIFDWGVYFETPQPNKAEDYYGKLMVFFAEHIEMKNYRKDWYSICEIEKFIMEYLEQFTKFMDEENKEDYRPSNYEPLKDIEDYLMYDIYIPTLESLIVGNYSEQDYKKLYKYLTGE